LVWRSTNVINGTPEKYKYIPTKNDIPMIAPPAHFRAKAFIMREMLPELKLIPSRLKNQGKS
jgi:hypothetical protein